MTVRTGRVRAQRRSLQLFERSSISTHSELEKRLSSKILRSLHLEGRFSLEIKLGNGTPRPSAHQMAELETRPPISAFSPFPSAISMLQMQPRGK